MSFPCSALAENFVSALKVQLSCHLSDGSMDALEQEDESGTRGAELGEWFSDCSSETSAVMAVSSHPPQ